MSLPPDDPTQFGPDATRPHVPFTAEELRAELRRRWAEGDRVDAEKLLPLDADPTLTLSLVLEEMTLRRDRGEPLSPDELRRRWPDLADEIQRRLDQEDEPSAITELAAGAVPPPPLPAPELVRIQIPGYEIERILGRGGMGIVYLARQIRFNRPVALKMIVAGGQASAEDLARFRTEAEAIGRLNNPNIVQVFDIGEWLPEAGPSLPYFSMEYCPGGSLSARLAGTPQQPRLAAQLALALTRAVEAAHAAGIVHRDLKPANVLLTEDGTPKVTDFGLAKKLDDDSHTRSGSIMGTPGYMAPEQAAGRTHEIGPAADLYALGAILYEMLVGQVPFKGASVLETLDMVRNREPVAPRVLQPRVPRDLETICLKCLQKAPARRYASATELADDLTRFLEGRPIEARPVGVAERGWRWARRHRALAGLYAVSTVALLALVAGGFWLSARIGAANVEVDKKADEADGARRLGETRHYFGLLNQVRARAARRAPGWAGANLADLAEAAKLPDAAANLPELRSEAAACLTAVDVDRLPPLLPGKQATSVAWHPDGHRVALGERATGFVMCFVCVIDLRRPDEVHSLTLTPRFLMGKNGLPVPDIVVHLAFTPDGRWLVAGMRSGALHRWRIDKGETKPAASWSGGKVESRVFALSADGRRLYTNSENVLTVWDTDTWKPMAVRTFAQRVEQVADLPAEGEILCAAGGWHRLEANTLEPTRPMEARPENVFETMPGGRLLAVAGDTVRVLRLDLSTGYALTVPDLGTTHEAGYIRIAANRAGDLALTACPGDRRARLWDLVGGTMLADLPFDAGEARAAFSPDGRSFVLLGAKETLLYRLRGLREAGTAAVFPQSALWFDTHPDGRSLVGLTAYGDPKKPFQEVALWPLGDGPAREARVRWPVYRAFGHARESRVGLTGPGYRLAHGYTDAVTSDTTIRWVDLEGGASSARTTPGPLAGGFAPEADGRVWMTRRDEVLAVERDAPEPRLRWVNGLGELFTGRSGLYGLAAGPKRLAVAGRDGTLRLFPTNGPTLEPKASIHVTGAAQLVVALSSDERLALVGSERGELSLVDLDREEVVARGVGHEGEIAAVAFAPGGLLLSAATDNTLRVWGRDPEGLRERFQVRLNRSVRRMKLLPDGVTLLMLLARERGVRRLRLDLLLERFRDLGIDGDLPRLAAGPLPPAVPFAAPVLAGDKAEKGFRAELFQRPGLSGPLLVRTDPAIDHDWTNRQPAPSIGDRGYSVRWTGTLTAPRPGRYILRLQGADGMRLWLDGHKRIDLWPNRGPGPYSIEADFTTDPQAIRVEMNQLMGQEKPRLSWSSPGEKDRVIDAANVTPPARAVK